MAGGLVGLLWEEWGIQVLVLLSFMLQVFLLTFAGIRRRKASAVLRLVLWLAYLLADSTAIYALGCISVTSRSLEHRLVVFWAPFLVLHLGGQDTITAYALEDNRLWLRHLLTLVVQVLWTAYIVYKAMAGADTFLLLATMFMFIVGVVKYGERTWALRCSNMANIRSSLKRTGVKNHLCGQLQGIKGDLDQENLLLLAHSVFDISKAYMVDSSVEVAPSPSDDDSTGLVSFGWKEICTLVELELSLLYDILYTKAAVIHTWYGLFIRVTALSTTLAAFLLFQLSIKDGFSEVDITVSYILVVGALLLEIASVLRSIGSTWTCDLIHSRKWHRLLHMAVSLRRCVGAQSYRSWSGTISQYNLLHLCTRDTMDLSSKLTKKMGLQDLWKEVHYSGTLSMSSDVRELVFMQIFKIMESSEDAVKNERGGWVLRRSGLYSDLRWSIDADYHESILIWSIATDIVIVCGKQANLEESATLRKATSALSNYILFLLVALPSMLPGPLRRNLYEQTCNDLVDIWQRHGSTEPRDQVSFGCNLFHTLKKLFSKDSPNSSRHREREKLARILLSKKHNLQTSDSPGPTLLLGIQLADQLLSKESNVPNLLQVIFGVWVETLCHAANRCSRDSHARQLSNGGELTSIVWLMSGLVGCLPKRQPGL
ncbi:uncharacterized protein LOC119306998 [Triticum dicoccoides]|uniref:uncharacterized protein LOC119306998 n=1 Tax=Triticum dicoccoides TaxID=85692 RepID=UPI000E7889D1|nr:uncharacterized protein LOC119306998 [Triticum dicoccoides]